MAERKITDLLAQELTPKPPSGSTPESHSVGADSTDLPPPGTPKYLTLERKDTRLRPGQLEELGKVTRKLNRRRKGAGERITDNTLIRLGVDLVLARAGDLVGCTEEELRQSLGLDP